MPDPRDPRGPANGHDGHPTGTPASQAGPTGPSSHPASHSGPRPVHRTRAEERAAEIDVSPSKLLADIEVLKAELATANTRSEEYLAGLQRERAEFTNYRRRTTEEREQMLGLAGEDLIRKVLAIADDFDLAIDNRPAELGDHSWVEGVAAIDRKLRALLESEGVRPIDTAAGMPFDPREHEAIATVPGTGRAEGEIVDVVRRGYKLRDRILRPALVAVAAAPDPAAPAH